MDETLKLLNALGFLAACFLKIQLVFNQADTPC